MRLPETKDQPPRLTGVRAAAGNARMETMIDDKIRRVMATRKEMTLYRTTGNQWQCSIRTPHKGFSYSVHVAADPVDAIRLACDSQLPKINLPGLPASAPLPGMPGWKP